MTSEFANFSQHGLPAGSQPWVSDSSIPGEHALCPHRSDTNLFALLLEHDLIAGFEAQSMTHGFGYRDLSFAGYLCFSLHCNLQFLTLSISLLTFQRTLIVLETCRGSVRGPNIYTRSRKIIDLVYSPLRNFFNLLNISPRCTSTPFSLYVDSETTPGITASLSSGLGDTSFTAPRRISPLRTPIIRF